MPRLIVIVALVSVGVAVYRWSRRYRVRGIEISPADPLWRAAVAQAQATMETFRELLAVHPDMSIVKVALVTTKGDREHVWASIHSMSESSMEVVIETSPRDRLGSLPSRMVVPITEVEDWHVALPDGRIRGSFTSQAEIRMWQDGNRRLPSRMQAVVRRFVDILECGAFMPSGSTNANSDRQDGVRGSA